MTVPVHLIEAKRDGASLDPAELRAFLEGYLDDEIADYQMSAFLMATLFRGMDPGELDVLVATMLGSGAVLDLGDLDRPRVDKHSTGGVGDKTSLVLAPLVAELGLYVPMMSGRGLGHTGGTLDKLEAIPGFRTDLDLGRFRAVLVDVGCAMIGQTAEIAPLDRRLYELRSVTGTVPSIPLIAASIMSKKLAEGLSALVLDVKVGSGAFLPDEAQALELARTMVTIGEGRGVRTEAVLTAMDRPLGCAVGNRLETIEALECLAGGGPSDLRRLVVHLATAMVRLAGDARAPELIEVEAGDLLDDGRALRRMERLVEAQGGDPRVVVEPDRLARAPVVREVRSGAAGEVTRLDPRPIGVAVVEMGGGRTRLGQTIDPRVGFRLAVAPGQFVEKDQVIAEVHAADESSAELGEQAISRAVRLGGEGGAHRPLISHRVSLSGTEQLAIG
jgi:pyrimidine-nucleoside phosphorylase